MLVIMGAGGVAIVAVDIALSQELDLAYCINDGSDSNPLLGVPVASEAEFQNMSLPRSEFEMLICISDGAKRKELAERYAGSFASIQHQTAVVSPSVEIGVGSMLFQGAIVQANASIGDHSIISTGASIDHECTVGNYVHVSPRATLCGNVKVGDGSFLGANCTILPGIKIGRNVTVGAGAVVTKDVTAGVTVAGIPAVLF